MDDLYVPDSFAGSIDEGKLKFMLQSFEASNPGTSLDGSYLQHIRQFHGGRLRRCWFQTSRGIRGAGRMLNFSSEETLLPSQRSNSGLKYDFLDWSAPNIDGIANLESAFSRGLFAFCLPYWGDEHPDDLLTSLHYSDLICLHHVSRKPAEVVLWRFSDASQEYSRCEEEGLEPWESMDVSRYTEFLSPSFMQFLDSLVLDPASLLR